MKALINDFGDETTMEKQHLPELLDDALLEKLYGFCYARTHDSLRAQELCSDIVLALVEASHAGGRLTEPYAFIWRVARNVYADFCVRRAREASLFDGGDPEDVLARLADETAGDDGDAERLTAVFRRIAFLTKAYREAMILFYMDGLSTAEIAARTGASETAVRQRLFAARNKIRSEVDQMEANEKPVMLDKLEFVLWGNGDPVGNDPRETCVRQLSKQVVWLCRKKPMRASEIAEALHVPTVYIEEEAELLAAGANGKYGLLRRNDDGRYALNAVLFDRAEMEQANAIYTAFLPMLCDTVASFIEAHKQDYLAYPFRNKKPELNLILWQQIHPMANAFERQIRRILKERHFADIKTPQRPYTICGYQDNGRHYGGGWDGVQAHDLCGFAHVTAHNIYCTRIIKHFGCGWDMANDLPLRLALRAIDGLAVGALSEIEREAAANAVECGYLYREGDMLYTKLLVGAAADSGGPFAVTKQLQNGYFDAAAEQTAEQLAGFIRRTLPAHLLCEWEQANMLAGLPLFTALVESLIERGLLTPPKDGLGAEGCWLAVE